MGISTRANSFLLLVLRGGRFVLRVVGVRDPSDDGAALFGLVVVVGEGSPRQVAELRLASDAGAPAEAVELEAGKVGSRGIGHAGDVKEL